MKSKLLLGAALCFGLAGFAQAEVLKMRGEFAAPNREASLLGSLSIDRFSGQDGPALARAIEQGLSGSHFELLGGRAGQGRADGSISGGVTSGVQETGFEKQEKRCVQKAKNGKCEKEEQVKLQCRRRVVNVNADLRMIDNRRGRIVYSASKPWRSELSWCRGEEPARTVEEMVGEGVRILGASVRDEITPSVRDYSIRVRESDKGLAKPVAARFKALIRQSARDPQGACAGWAAMRGEAPGHPSLLFDLGLCAEWGGRYEEAAAFYRDAARAGANEGNEGANRVAQLIAGREDARIRERR